MAWTRRCARCSAYPRGFCRAPAFAIVLAYTVRFLAASLGAVDLPEHQCRGSHARATISETLWRVYLPLLRPALGAAALLVLRGFDTLATQVFTLTSLYRYEEAELSALIMVVVSLAPVLLLHGVIVAGRPGSLTSPRRAASAKGVAETEGLLISQ